MISLVSGDLPMAGMLPMSQGLLPPWVTWLWLLALAAVLIFHCGHFVRMGGQHRWYHASHSLMLLSMLYMYASMEFTWRWFPSGSWVVIFWLSTAAIVSWMILRFVQRRPFSLLWILALIMQAAMIYMWMPDWAPVLTWTLVVYFALETPAWLGGLLDDTRPAMAVGPGEHAAGQPVVQGSANARVNVAVKPSTRAAARGQRAEVVALAQNTGAARASMAVIRAPDIGRAESAVLTV